MYALRLAALSLLVANAHASGEAGKAPMPWQRFIVLLQDYEPGDCREADCGTLDRAFISGASPSYEAREQLAVIRTRLPGPDLHDMISTAFCRELLNAEPGCAGVTVLGAEPPDETRRPAT